MMERPVVIQHMVKKRKLKLLYWIAGILIFLVFVLCVSLSLYVGWSLTHPDKEPVTASPADYGLEYDPVTFMSKDGQVRLSGWQIPPSEDKVNRETTLIFAHGYRQNRLNGNLETLSLVQTLSKEGFTILLFDFRNAGESEGDVTSIGYYEKQDLLGAVDFASQQHPQHTIGIIGFSMGAATAILAAAEDARIAAVVAESPFHDLRDYLKDHLSIWSGLPYFPFTPLILNLLPSVIDVDIDQVSPIRAVETVYPRPILFIHSTDDDKIPHTSSALMYQTHRDIFQYWEVEAAEHAKTYNMYPQEYVDRVIAFFDSL